jgi:hypothetical protein
MRYLQERARPTLLYHCITGNLARSPDFGILFIRENRSPKSPGSDLARTHRFFAVDVRSRLVGSSIDQRREAVLVETRTLHNRPPLAITRESDFRGSTLTAADPKTHVRMSLLTRSTPRAAQYRFERFPMREPASPEAFGLTIWRHSN